jgi:uncharacterized membrane protein YbhN (UPF0104 family)
MMLSDVNLSSREGVINTRFIVVTRLCLGLAASAFFLGALLAEAHPRAILNAIVQVRPEWAPLALLAIGTSFALRTQRWAILLRACGSAVRFRDAAVPLMGSVALNNLLPFRAGDAIRIIALQSFTGQVRSRQLGTLILERLFDLCALLSIVIAATWLWPPARLDPGWVFAADAVAAGAVVTLVGLLAAPSAARLAIAWSERHAAQFLPPGRVVLAYYEATRSLCRPGLLTQTAILTAAAWLAEGGGFWAAAKALGLANALPTAALGVGLATLSTGIPSLPAYLGTFDYFAATSAIAFGADRPHAVAFAVLVHALLWIPATALGWLLLIGAARIGVTRGGPGFSAQKGMVA